MDELDDILINEEHDIVEILINRQPRRPYNSQNRVNHVNHFIINDEDFIQRFRLSKPTVQFLCDVLYHDLNYNSERNKPFTPIEQLLIALRFYACGSFYITIGEFGIMHKTTAGKIIRRVTNAICAKRNTFIKFSPELNTVKQDFFNKARFPRVIGAIDCIHIRIQSPGGDNAEVFRNRKGYFSLNVQVVVDACYNIQDIVTRWPGSAHDANIFDNSQVRARFEHGEMGNGLLLGDSGYPNRNYIITPLANPVTEAEQRFNESHIRMRNVVERTFGIWKRRFPVLSLGIRCSIPLTQRVILATAVLHNLACVRGERLIDEDEPVHLGILEDIEPNGLNENDRVRRDIIDYFRNL